MNSLNVSAVRFTTLPHDIHSEIVPFLDSNSLFRLYKAVYLTKNDKTQNGHTQEITRIFSETMLKRSLNFLYFFPNAIEQQPAATKVQQLEKHSKWVGLQIQHWINKLGVEKVKTLNFSVQKIAHESDLHARRLFECSSLQHLNLNFISDNSASIIKNVLDQLPKSLISLQLPSLVLLEAEQAAQLPPSLQSLTFEGCWRGRCNSLPRSLTSLITGPCSLMNYFPEESILQLPPQLTELQFFFRNFTSNFNCQNLPESLVSLRYEGAFDIKDLVNLPKGLTYLNLFSSRPDLFIDMTDTDSIEIPPHLTSLEISLKALSLSFCPKSLTHLKLISVSCQNLIHNTLKSLDIAELTETQTLPPNLTSLNCHYFSLSILNILPSSLVLLKIPGVVLTPEQFQKLPWYVNNEFNHIRAQTEYDFRKERNA